MSNFHETLFLLCRGEPVHECVGDRDAGDLPKAHSAHEFPAVAPLSAGASPAVSPCPQDLTALTSTMEEVLAFVTSSSLRDTLLASLQASIPEAIEHAESLAGEIAFLKDEIRRQEQLRAHAEQVAREELDDPSAPLLPCSREVEEGYCYAVEQFYASTAANLANKAFLDALECYQREGRP